MMPAYLLASIKDLSVWIILGAQLVNIYFFKNFLQFCFCLLFSLTVLFALLCHSFIASTPNLLQVFDRRRKLGQKLDVIILTRSLKGGTQRRKNS